MWIFGDFLVSYSRSEGHISSRSRRDIRPLSSQFVCYLSILELECFLSHSVSMDSRSHSTAWVYMRARSGSGHFSWISQYSLWVLVISINIAKLWGKISKHSIRLSFWSSSSMCGSISRRCISSRKWSLHIRAHLSRHLHSLQLLLVDGFSRSDTFSRDLLELVSSFLGLFWFHFLDKKI